MSFEFVTLQLSKNLQRTSLFRQPSFKDKISESDYKLVADNERIKCFRRNCREKICSSSSIVTMTRKFNGAHERLPVQMALMKALKYKFVYKY